MLGRIGTQNFFVYTAFRGQSFLGKKSRNGVAAHGTVFDTIVRKTVDAGDRKAEQTLFKNSLLNGLSQTVGNDFIGINKKYPLPAALLNTETTLSRKIPCHGVRYHAGAEFFGDGDGGIGTAVVNDEQFIGKGKRR